MILRAFLLVLTVAAAAASGAAQAQQYRWVDRNGVTEFGDAPPPGARKIHKISMPTSAGSDTPALPFEIARVQKDFPVTLYTTPSCKDLCEQARAALNRRSVPFSEFQIWNEETQQKMKSVTGSNQIPALMVGRSLLRGFEQGQFDKLLDSAGYPAAGTYPARNQAAPALPEGYTGPEAAAAKTAATKAAPARKSGPYDASGLTGPAPRPGQYGLPGESK